MSSTNRTCGICGAAFKHYLNYEQFRRAYRQGRGVCVPGAAILCHRCFEIACDVTDRALSPDELQWSKRQLMEKWGELLAHTVRSMLRIKLSGLAG